MDNSKSISSLQEQAQDLLRSLTKEPEEWWSPVVGVTFEGRQETLLMLEEMYAQRVPLRAELVPEPENEYDKNAIAIHILEKDDTRHHVGYLPKEKAAELNGVRYNLKDWMLTRHPEKDIFCMKVCVIVP